MCHSGFLIVSEYFPDDWCINYPNIVLEFYCLYLHYVYIVFFLLSRPPWKSAIAEGVSVKLLKVDSYIFLPFWTSEVQYRNKEDERLSCVVTLAAKVRIQIT